MLTPAIDDPNRKEELKRRKADPAAFGSPALSPEDVSRRDFSRSGLVEDDPTRKPQPEEPTDKVTTLVDFLKQSVSEITPQLSGLSNDQLTEMMTTELAGGARVTLLSAIETELTNRQGA